MVRARKRRTNRASIDPAILMTPSIALRIYPKLNAERITLINVKATAPTKPHYPQPTQSQTYASMRKIGTGAVN